MKESEFLGTLLPSHPDFFPIVQSIREKYSLPEISPDYEAIKEIFLGEKIIPLEEFRKDIENQIRQDLSFMPPDLLKLYLPEKAFSKTQHRTQIEEEFKSLPDEVKNQFEDIVKFTETITNYVIQILDPMIDSIVNILYIHLLMGEIEDIPNDWISKAATVTAMGEPMVMAMAGPLANPDIIIQQFRQEYKKTFGEYHPKITNTVTRTAYYYQPESAIV